MVDVEFHRAKTCSGAPLQVEDWKDGKLVSVEEVTESEEEAAADTEDGEWDEDEQVTARQHTQDFVWHGLMPVRTVVKHLLRRLRPRFLTPANRQLHGTKACFSGVLEACCNMGLQNASLSNLANATDQSSTGGRGCFTRESPLDNLDLGLTTEAGITGY